MKKLFATLTGAAVIAASAAVTPAAILGTLASSVAVTPAAALGACGPNRHRNAFGHCVFGGQNQDWCLRHTGHVATYVGYGRRHCF